MSAILNCRGAVMLSPTAISAKIKREVTLLRQEVIRLGYTSLLIDEAMDRLDNLAEELDGSVVPPAPVVPEESAISTM